MASDRKMVLLISKLEALMLVQKIRKKMNPYQ